MFMSTLNSNYPNRVARLWEPDTFLSVWLGPKVGRPPGNSGSPLSNLALSLAVCGLLTSSSLAQDGLDELIGTVGTTVSDSTGRTWAYLLWDASRPELLAGRTFAIYGKAGTSTNQAPFARMAILGQQTDPRVIEPLLHRGEYLGDNLANLSFELDNLFAKLLPVSALPNADKLSAVIRGSVADPAHFQNLLLLARLHPGVALACGVAYAQIITNLPVTFEVRLFDQSRGSDIAVIGRVTLGTLPTSLPAPDQPVEVVDASPKGHLNVKLRWGTSNALRRLGVMHHGFNVWRVTRAYAEANNWDSTPPARLPDQALLSPGTVHQCNHRPILTSVDFTAAEASNFSPAGGDTNTVFYADDDGQFAPGYSPLATGFTNGAQFYYYVTARDVLGRDGDASPGTLVTLCDRMPPPPPDGVRVVNDYAFAGVTSQHLRVIWNQSTNATDPVTNYWIYRWTNTVSDMLAEAKNPYHNLIAVVRHTNGLNQANYLDNGPESPSVLRDLGKTVWYTVRAQDYGACGPNLSANSGPAYGVLRDREGPEAPSGCIEIAWITPEVAFLGTNQSSQGFPGHFAFTLNCTRTSPEIACAAFKVFIKSGTAILETIASGPIYFSPGSSRVAFDVHTALSTAYQNCTAWIQTIAATSDMNVSAVQEKALNLSKLPPRVIYNFEARLRIESDCLDAATKPQKHYPNKIGTNNREFIFIKFNSMPTGREYRVYREVDGGPQTLICQGTNMLAVNTCTDDSLPANAATICYFVQELDEHGNPSPLADLGCVELQVPSATLPVPTLSPITATNSMENPSMKLEWFCPVAGVERFQLGISGPLGTNVAADLSLATNIYQEGFPLDAPTNLLVFSLFYTPRIGAAFGDGPRFSVVVTNLQLGGSYVVFVRAVAKEGTCGQRSDLNSFSAWTPPSQVPGIRWPARGLPATNFNPAVVAAYLTSQALDFEGGAVLIGSREFSNQVTFVDQKKPFTIDGTVEDPLRFLITTNNSSLFPLVMYRCQVTNANYSRVSGDIIQVTPLMETIAYRITTNISSGQPVIKHELLDPFVLYDRSPGSSTSTWQLNLYLLDTQPVIRGAKYRYLLVHFGSNHEMDYILPTNDMEVP
jgi:hypothetical protein